MVDIAHLWSAWHTYPFYMVIGILVVILLRIRLEAPSVSTLDYWGFLAHILLYYGMDVTP